MLEKDFDLRSFLIGKLRSLYKLTPAYAAVRKAAEVLVDVPLKNGKTRQLKHFRCAHCNRLFRDKGVQEVVAEDGTIQKRKFRAQIAVDHILPVVGLAGWDDYNGFIERHFLGKVQVLCNYSKKEKHLYGGVDSCHYTKTKAENALRPKKPKKEKK